MAEKGAEDKWEPRDGFQTGMMGADENCDQITFSGRKEKWNLRANKDADEKECAERFCRFQQKELTKFTKMPPGAVDIRAESADKKYTRDFQVTSMLPEELWARYGRAGTTDVTISYDELKELTRASIDNKFKQRSSSQDVDLLIDCKPAELPAQCLQKIDSDKDFRREISGLGNFRQIWVVSSQGVARLK